MDNTTTGLPPGWKRPNKHDDKSCVVHKHLEDFKYAEVRYEPGADAFSHDYALYEVNCDGQYHASKKGVYEDLGKAIRAGEKL